MQSNWPTIQTVDRRPASKRRRSTCREPRVPCVSRKPARISVSDWLLIARHSFPGQNDGTTKWQTIMIVGHDGASPYFA